LDEDGEEFSAEDNRIIVVVADGASLHRVYPPNAWMPAKMNLEKITDKCPVTLKEKLVELNLWWKVANYRAKVAPARKLLYETDAWKAQRIEPEEIAKKFYGVYLLGPSSLPCFNSKELFYRYTKGDCRQLNAISFTAVKQRVFEILEEDDEDSRGRARHWFDVTRSYRLWYHQHRGEAVVVPSERVVKRWRRDHPDARIDTS